MRRDVKAFIWLLSFILFTSYSVFAQGSFGSIKGTVSDTAGAALSGATVEIKNQDTNETRTVTTGSQGEFIANNLNVGSYSIIANSQGFSTTTAKDVRVSVAFTTEQNITLNPAGSAGDGYRYDRRHGNPDQHVGPAALDDHRQSKDTGSAAAVA